MIADAGGRGARRDAGDPRGCRVGMTRGFAEIERRGG